IGMPPEDLGRPAQPAMSAHEEQHAIRTTLRRRQLPAHKPRSLAQLHTEQPAVEDRLRLIERSAEFLERLYIPIVSVLAVDGEIRRFIQSCPEFDHHRPPKHPLQLFDDAFLPALEVAVSLSLRLGDLMKRLMDERSPSARRVRPRLDIYLDCSIEARAPRARHVIDQLQLPVPA